MTSQVDYKFQGWLGSDRSSVKGQLQWQSYEPKKWEDTDVDIKITHCGVCGSSQLLPLWLLLMALQAAPISTLFAADG